MDWKRIFNPWSSLRDAETRIAVLEKQCDDLYERAETAEDRAFHRAAEHYYQRSRMVEAQLAHTQQQLVTIASLTPPGPFAVPQADIEAFTAHP